MSTKTKPPEGHEGLWGPGMEPKSVRDKYAELQGEIPAPRQSPEEDSRG